MVTASFISWLSHAVDLIEKRSQQGRSWKIVKVRHLRCGGVMLQLARLPLREGCVMNSLRGCRDPRSGRVCGFQSSEQRQNFMVGRARFCNGPNREMPRCYGAQSLGRALQGSEDARPGRPASATAVGCCQTSAPGRCAPFRRPRPHPARRDASPAQPAARPLAARSARAWQDHHADIVR